MIVDIVYIIVIVVVIVVIIVVVIVVIVIVIICSKACHQKTCQSYSTSIHPFRMFESILLIRAKYMLTDLFFRDYRYEQLS